MLVDGDPGYIPGEQHGLIAATADQSTGIKWSLAREIPVENTNTAYGTGSANTDAIIDQNGAGITYAASLARAYDGGGYSDWFLSSEDALNKLNLNQDAIGGFVSTL